MLENMTTSPGENVQNLPSLEHPDGSPIRVLVADDEPMLEELVVGDLVLNQDTREVTRAGQDIQLTATQFELLRYLMENAKRVVSKAQILDNVWNYDFGGQANIVELYISYLRKKIDAGRSPMIHTVRGAGYVIKPASDQ